MSTAIATPKAANTAQDTVARNVKMMIEARELPKKDFAKVLGVSPQMVARKLRSDTTWSINDMQAAAAFLNVDMATLLQPNLTVPQIYGLGDNNDDGTGGGYGASVSGAAVFARSGGQLAYIWITHPLSTVVHIDGGTGQPGHQDR